MAYKLTTVEVAETGGRYENVRLLGRPGTSLATTVEHAHRFGWLPGATSGTGLTIVETIIEST
jgi:hypothetical protein